MRAALGRNILGKDESGARLPARELAILAQGSRLDEICLRLACARAEKLRVIPDDMSDHRLDRVPKPRLVCGMGKITV